MLRAVSLEPDNAVVCGELGLFFRRQRRIADARLVQQRLVEIEPDNVAHWITLRASSQLGDDDSAEAALKRVIGMRPERAIGYASLAQLYLKTGSEQAGVGSPRPRSAGNDPSGRDGHDLLRARRRLRSYQRPPRPSPRWPKMRESAPNRPPRLPPPGAARPAPRRLGGSRPRHSSKEAMADTDPVPEPPALLLLVCFCPPLARGLPNGLSDPTGRRDVPIGNHVSAFSRRQRSEYLSEFMVAGLALFDYDGDGLIDIYFLNGAPLKGRPSPTRVRETRCSATTATGRSRMSPGRAGVGDARATLWASPAADHDNDGDQDLYVNNFGPNVFYRNEGDGTFTDITDQARVGLRRPLRGRHLLPGHRGRRRPRPVRGQVRRLLPTNAMPS